MCSGITGMSPVCAAASPARRLSDDRLQLNAAGQDEPATEAAAVAEFGVEAIQAGPHRISWARLLSAPRAGLRPARPPVGVKETWGGPAFP